MKINLLMLLLPAICLGQETAPTCRFKVSNVWINFGAYSINQPVLTADDFRKLAPKSELLKTDFTAFNNGGNYFTDDYYDDLNSQSTFEGLVGIKFLKKKTGSYKSNPELRLGFIYQNGTSFSRSYRDSEVFPYDTLTSGQTGQVLYVDSIKTTNFTMNHESEQIRFHASLLFRYKPEARWSLYGGAGVSAGTIINAQTQIYYNYTEYTNYSYTSSSPSPNNESKSESFNNKSGVTFSSFVTAGLDFRLGKKREFWQRFHICYEIRPMIDYMNIPELRSFTNGVVHQSFALRFNID